MRRTQTLIQNKDEAIREYQMRFWQSLAEILEAVKPLVIKSVEEAVNNERERFQRRNS